MEEVITDDEFPLQKAREILKDEIVAVLGYGVQGPGQALNMRDNGIHVIVGQRENSVSWDRAVADGFVPGKTLFPVVEAARKGTVIQYLLSDAGQMAVWPQLIECLAEAAAVFKVSTSAYGCRIQRYPAPPLEPCLRPGMAMPGPDIIEAPKTIPLSRNITQDDP